MIVRTRIKCESIIQRFNYQDRIQTEPACVTITVLLLVVISYPEYEILVFRVE